MTLAAVDLDLGELLVAASQGDVDAFMRFYDATSDYAFGLALSRACARGLSGPDAREAAEDEAERRFVSAWERAYGYDASGLSALTWLLCLDVAEQHADNHSLKEDPCPL